MQLETVLAFVLCYHSHSLLRDDPIG